MKQYLYTQLAHYLKLHVLPEDPVLEVEPKSPLLRENLERAGRRVRTAGCSELAGLESADDERNFVILNGTLHYERDIQGLLALLCSRGSPQTRIVAIFYSSLWRPLIALATRLGWRQVQPEANWVAPEDLANLCHLTDLEIVRHDRKILLPIQIPLLTYLVNRFIAPLPGISSLCMVNLMVLRPRRKPAYAVAPSVTVLVPARNEAGNIESIVNRLPAMGPDDELIFVEGHSSDETWKEIQRVQAAYAGRLTIRIAQQDGKGKGDAVRKGFAMARREILMILDADMTVPPEDLPKFYRAIVDNHGEFINGSRLVYPLEDKAMRFFNILGNKFFALAFTLVLGQRLKDTLCGTKVLTRANYERIARNRDYFGDFDPFGDFDLLFGASRLGLKIVELPIRYQARTYGDTNIDRWRHGVILLKMLLFASRKIKFI